MELKINPTPKLFNVLKHCIKCVWDVSEWTWLLIYVYMSIARSVVRTTQRRCSHMAYGEKKKVPIIIIVFDVDNSQFIHSSIDVRRFPLAFFIRQTTWRLIHESVGI